MNDAFDTAATAGTISAEACQALKTDILKSAVEKAHKEALEVLHGKSSEEYTTAYVDRNPWVKDLQNARDTWQRHFTAIQRNAKQWEEKVRSAYMAKAKSGILSPLLALIGEYLLYSPDKEAGRQSLLEILYLQEPSKRLSIHNWHILDLVSGATETHGPKVERLKMPLFPPGNAELEALNAKILLLEGEVAGGSASRRAEGMRGCSSPRTRCCTRAGRRTGYPCLTRTGPRPPMASTWRRSRMRSPAWTTSASTPTATCGRRSRSCARSSRHTGPFPLSTAAMGQASTRRGPTPPDAARGAQDRSTDAWAVRAKPQKTSKTRRFGVLPVGSARATEPAV
eukprot:gene10514-biopygen7479